jgi:hypothetical protein
MRSVKLITARFLPVLFVSICLQMSAFAQENSPYSRYGIGDLAPNRNVANRAMGGIAAGISNSRYMTEIQSINFTNPASLANIYNTVFDVAAEVSFRTLKSTNPAKKFTSANSYFSYLQAAFPLTTPKMFKKDMRWVMSFGLRPVSKINYKIEKNERLSGIDSLNTIYEGSGGVNQAFVGTGFRAKNFSIGVNVGYMFGSKDYSTRLGFVNDSIVYYYSNSSNKTNFGGAFINGGVQYDIEFDRDPITKYPKLIRLGLYGNLQQNLRASRDDVRESISYDANGGFYRLDSIYDQKDIKGTVKLPAVIGGGFSYVGKFWTYGADFEFSNWANYRYYDQTDQVQNSWTIRAGAQYYPAKESTPTSRYFRFVKYRAGFYYGSDYIKVGKNRPDYGFTIGTGMPLTTLKTRSYTNEYVVLNTALEIGNRGNKQTNIRENVVRFTVGVAMNARWFQKPKYN